MDTSCPLRYRRIVAKLGTNLLTGGSDRLDLEVMSSLASQVSRLHRQQAEIIIITSGAITAGSYKLRHLRSRAQPSRQVRAALGQSELMHAYDQLFSWHDIPVAQALISRRDVEDRSGYLNVRNTLLALLDLGAVPIVNENDVVSTDEIEGVFFGDNDNLSGMVANLVDADLLALLTDIEGLFTADPRQDPNARLIPRVDTVDRYIEAIAQNTTNTQAIGGMATKIQAAKLATVSGVAVSIAHGRTPNVLKRLAYGEELGTLFPPSTSKLESRKRWMLSRVTNQGSLVVDEGAAKALREGRGSLLPVGVREVRGIFSRGDIVDILNGEDLRLARGICNYSSSAIKQLQGRRSQEIEQAVGYHFGDEVVHRNNLVLI